MTPLDPTPLTVPHPPVGDPPSFRDVYVQHAAFVWSSLRRLGVREADTEDLCQEVFVVVHRRLPDAGVIGSMRGWLFGICLRSAADYRRRAHIRREHVTSEVPEPMIPTDASPDEIDLRRARSQLDALLAAMDDERRAVFILYELEELPMSEIAASLGCPLQTAYSRLHAARKEIEAGIRRLHAREASR